ncbi:MAG: hypothetical protein ACKOXK_03970 [Chakrabartia sp.]
MNGHANDDEDELVEALIEIISDSPLEDADDDEGATVSEQLSPWEIEEIALRIAEFIDDL